MRRLITGYDFQGMVLSALNNIRIAEKTVNSMNVFPVADGDTGTNMRLTIENGYKKANNNRHLGSYLKELASGMLLGARGNSGVILSQLFKGMSISLEDKGIVNPKELKNALISAYETAYKAVVNPVEGTILTVAREGIENIKEQIYGNITIEGTLKLYLQEMNESLKRTPELLDVLKEASVLDSGAYGYIIIIEGMYKYLIGEQVDGEIDVEVKEEANTPIYFDENSEFIEGYCTEFLLQLLNSKDYKNKFDLNQFIGVLKTLGNSLVVLQEGSIVKVHIHTLNPSPVIEEAKKYGEFISFKLENMQLQHNEYQIVKNKDKTPAKELGIIAVVNGEELENIYRDLGADYIISADGNMNSSSEEFLTAINSVNAKKIVIFPNNINTFGAANQAIDLAKAKERVFIIPSKSMIETIVALQMDMPDDDTDSRISEFNSNIKLANTIGVTTASKNYKKDGFCCKINDKIGLINDELVSSGDSVVKVLEDTLNKVEDFDSKSGMLIYLGKSVDEKLESDINDLIADKFSGIEYQITYGKQDIYDVLIGLF